MLCVRIITFIIYDLCDGVSHDTVSNINIKATIPGKSAL